MCRLHQQRPQQPIASLTDPELRLMISAVPLLGLQSQKWTHIPAVRESCCVLDGQYERQRNQRPYPVYLRQQFDVRIPFRDFVDLLVIHADLLAQRLDAFQQWLDRALRRLAEASPKASPT